MRRLALTLVVVMAFAAGCSWTRKATDFSGLTGPDGKKVAHLNTTRIGLNLLITRPLLGEATLQSTVAELTGQAKGMGASQIQIVQSRQSTLWFVYPPFSFIVCPVISNAAGDVYLGAK